MELTPEKFEKAEFTERRRGYDIDQVESFLEETGTEFAQMLAKFRHTEQRAASAEARLADGESKLSEVNRVLDEADQRIRRAEDAARAARAEAESLRNSVAAAGEREAQADENAEVERVAKTLVIAQRTADATIQDAESRAESLLDEARGRADRQMAEAINEAEAIVIDARRRAEDEFAERHAAALEAVTELEGRRSQIEGVIVQLEGRLTGYREDLMRTAAELNSLAEDPTAIGPREGMSILPDEVIGSSEGHSVDDTFPEESHVDEPLPAPAQDSREDALSAGEPQSYGDSSSDGGGTAAQEAISMEQPASAPVESSTASAAVDGYLDLTSAPAGAAGEALAAGDGWGPGSWSELESTLGEEPASARERVSAAPIATNASTSATAAVNSYAGTALGTDDADDRPTQAVSRADLPRDKYLEELDHAVNTAEDTDDEALAAFLDGGVDSKARRFGWRR
ncbi:MAG: hypothetical protein WBA45_17960 [Microthrixaceae bacterium]